TVSRAWTKMEHMGLGKGASQENLTFQSDIEAALKNADFVQENVPEREDLKRSIIADIDRYAPKETIIASSTSGILPSTIQLDCAYHPERVIVAHPFNPVYLIPLVEIVGGKKTKASYID